MKVNWIGLFPCDVMLTIFVAGCRIRQADANGIRTKAVPAARRRCL